MSSNLFLSNNLEDALRLTETPTNTYFKNQDNEVTSDVFMSQINSKNINDLVSMLTSENNFTNKYNNTNATSEQFPHVDFTLSGTSQNLDSNLTSTIMPQNITLSDTSVLNTQQGGALTSTTDTEQLENQLRKLLGGGKTRKSKSKKTSRKRKSRKSSTKRKSKSKAKSKKGSKKGSKKRKSRKSRKSKKSQTGGAKKRKSRKSSTKRKSKSKAKSKKGSKKGSKKRKSRKMKGGSENEEGSCPPCPADKKPKKKRKPNPGFMAFQKLKKHVAEGLGIPNSVKAAKAAGAALRAVKEAHPDIDSVAAANKAMKEFDDNKDKYAKHAK
jgi:hypothetical protein